MTHKFQIAPVGPSRRSSIGRSARSSLTGRSPAIIHDQTNDGRWAGATLSRNGASGCDRHTPARFDLTGQGNVKTNCGRCFGIGRLFEQYGIGRRVNALHAINPNAADHSGNDAVEPLKRHFKNLRFYSPEAICGDVVSAGTSSGEIQNV